MLKGAAVASEPDEMEQARCSCGAMLSSTALACGLCHAPVAAVAGSAPNLGPTARMDERVFSRVRPGPLSFGPLGRVVISVLMLVPLVFIWFMSGGGVVTLVCTIPAALLPLWYLRETWRRQRVR